MTLVLGCIADDYTGASDVANMLAKCGLATVQTIDVPPNDWALPDVDAVVISMKIRSVPAQVAVERALAAHRWLRSRGASHVLYKICSTFDSTNVGNIGPVTEALRQELGKPLVLVTPAFPEAGRTVYQGHLFVGAQRLDESSLKDHPLNPMRDSSLVRTLSRQCRERVEHIPLAFVDAGAESLRVEVSRLAANGVAMAIVDSIFERHLDTLGEIAVEQPLSTGASGMAMGLAHVLVQSRPALRKSTMTTALQATGGKQAIVVGSCSQATLRQIAAAATHMPVLKLDVERLVSDPACTAEALQWAVRHLDSGPVLIASSAPSDQVKMLQLKHGVDTASHAIEQALATIAAGLVAVGVRRLVVAGGETSGAVVDRLGIRAFAIQAEITPGVPLLRTIGMQHEEMLVALKSGNFGGPEFFSEALALMQ